MDSNKNLIDVPVLITNFRDKFQNEPNKSEETNKHRLVHRFFIYDTISGIDVNGGYANNANPKIVRFA